MSKYIMPDWARDIVLVHFPTYGAHLTVYQGGDGCHVIGRGFMHPHETTLAFVLRHTPRGPVSHVESKSGGKYALRLSTRYHYRSSGVRRSHYTLYTLNRESERLVALGTYTTGMEAYVAQADLGNYWLGVC